MKTIHKSLLLMLTVAILAVNLFGIASSSAFAEAGFPTDEPITLRWSAWGGVSRHEQRQSWAEQFMKEYPNVTIEYEAETEDSLVEKILVQTRAGEAPDIYQNTSFHLQDFWDKGLMVDLTPYVENGMLSTNGYEELRKIGQLDGVQVQWPTLIATMNGIYYNASKLAELGMEMPQNGWYWDDFEAYISEASAKIAEKGWTDIWVCEDEGGLYRTFEGWLVSKGKSMFSNDGLNFEKADLIEWLTMWDNYRKAGYVPPADITSEYSSKSWEASMVCIGKVLMNNQSYSHLVGMDELTDDTMDLVTPPWAIGGVEESPVISAGFCISPTSKNVDAAIFFLNWLNQSEFVQRSCFDIYGSSTNSVWNATFSDMIATGAIETKDGLVETIAYQEYLSPLSVPYPPMPSGSSACEDLLTAANEMVAFGEMTAEEAAEDFFEQSAQLFAH